MKRWIVIVAAMAFTASCSAYSVSDLPAGWGIDPNQIQGTLLPAYAGTPDGADPNTWLMPVGRFTREGGTNGWVAGLRFVSSEPHTSSDLFLFYDTDTGQSTTWTLNGWVRPGPNYKVIDAWSWPTRKGVVKKQLYTVVVIGVAPDDAFPIVE